MAPEFPCYPTLTPEIVSATRKVIEQNKIAGAKPNCVHCHGTGWEWIAGYHPSPHPCICTERVRNNGP